MANRIAELHVELETLSPDTQAHPAVAFPRKLEQALMEGTYRQVLAASANSPSEHMQPLLQQLAATVRDELAACASAVCLPSKETRSGVPVVVSSICMLPLSRWVLRIIHHGLPVVAMML